MLLTNTPTFTPDFGGEPARSVDPALVPRKPDADGWAPATPRPVPPLLSGVSGASEETAKAVSNLEALMLERFKAGYLHTCAEIDGDPAVAEVDARFQEAIRREEEAAFALLDESITDAADRRVRLTAFLRSRALFEAPVREWREFSAAEAVDRLDEEELAPAMKYLLGSSPEGRGAAQAITAAEAAWRGAVAEYEAAQAEEQRLSELADVATASAEAEAPMPSILTDGRATYRTEEQIMQATGLSPERRLEMIVALRSWHEARATAEERHACAEAHDRWDEYRRGHETMEALVDCPAPNPAALAYKVRAWLERAHIDRSGQDVDDPGTLAELLATAPLDGAWAPVRFYQDALRMSGQRPDIVAVEPFDVEGWVDEFVAHPGHYLDARGPIYVEPEAFPGGDVRNEPPGRKAWSELTPALRGVVRSYASQKVKLGELPDPYGMADADFPLLAAE